MGPQVSYGTASLKGLMTVRRGGKVYYHLRQHSGR